MAYSMQSTYTIGNDVYNSATGQLVTPEQQQAAMSKSFAPIVQADQAIQNAGIDTATQKDVMALNQKASENTNRLAMSQGQRRVVGGGYFQPKGINANSAIAGLSSANARAVGEQKKKQVATTLGTLQGQYGALSRLRSAASSKATEP